MELTTTSRSLREILKAHFFFIPRFQRPYSWTRDNVEELWEDALQGEAGDYFIGSMVVYRQSLDTRAVIDGQQRLTTLMMLLCALRDAAQAQGHTALANGTHGFIERRDENDESRFVLATETSYPYLQDEVLSRDEAELDERAGREEQGISEAYDRIKEFVDDLVTSVLDDPTLREDRRQSLLGKRLQEVRDRVLNLKLIFIEVGDQDEATTIFVTLNSRGKDLEPADLIKAHLLALMPRKSGLDRPLEKWQSIVERFDASSAQPKMTDFLMTVWRSRYENVSSKNLSRRVRRVVKKGDARRFLDELLADAEMFRQVVEPEYRAWRKPEFEARESLQFFRDFGIKIPAPLLLSLLRCFDRKEITYKQLRRALKAVEDYHFAYNTLANKSSSGGISAFYSRRARDLAGAPDKGARSLVIDELIAELRAKRPTSTEFDEAFTNLWLTDSVTSEKKVVQYILRRLYQHEVAGSGTDFSKMTIEHLTPQAVDSSEVGRIGNLVLITGALNTKLGDKPFAHKVPLLKAAKADWIPSEVLRASSWTDEDIEKRTRSLAKTGRTSVWNG